MHCCLVGAVVRFWTRLRRHNMHRKKCQKCLAAALHVAAALPRTRRGTMAVVKRALPSLACAAHVGAECLQATRLTQGHMLQRVNASRRALPRANAVVSM